MRINLRHYSVGTENRKSLGRGTQPYESEALLLIYICGRMPAVCHLPVRTKLILLSFMKALPGIAPLMLPSAFFLRLIGTSWP